MICSDHFSAGKHHHFAAVLHRCPKIVIEVRGVSELDHDAGCVFVFNFFIYTYAKSIIYCLHISTSFNKR